MWGGGRKPKPSGGTSPSCRRPTSFRHTLGSLLFGSFHSVHGGGEASYSHCHTNAYTNTSIKVGREGDNRRSLVPKSTRHNTRHVPSTPRHLIARLSSLIRETYCRHAAATNALPSLPRKTTLKTSTFEHKSSRWLLRKNDIFALELYKYVLRPF